MIQGKLSEAATGSDAIFISQYVEFKGMDIGSRLLELGSLFVSTICRQLDGYNYFEHANSNFASFFQNIQKFLTV